MYYSNNNDTVFFFFFFFFFFFWETRYPALHGYGSGLVKRVPTVLTSVLSFRSFCELPLKPLSERKSVEN